MTETASYVERVNRAIDHVLENLTQALPLDLLAAKAGFSSFHFHRIFKGLMGETLQQFVARLRLERALFFMCHDPSLNLTRVALRCGFASSSDFSRAFKKRFGVPPSAFDLDAFRRERRAELNEVSLESGEVFRLDRLPPNENPDGFEVAMRELPARTFAYLRVLDPFRPDVVVDAARELVDWAEERGLADQPWYGYMWEHPDVVPLKDCRYDVAVEVPPTHRWADEKVSRIDFAPMLAATLSLRGDIHLEQRALDWIFLTWLPASGYLPTEQPSFEAWHGRPFAHGTEHFEIDLHLPVRRI